ncbi:hypothetical protein [Amycolatopsis sp. cmx-4-61]|uniref:hypothetical protein n=1 Tax=Amycolatopsis sp. cmx-4-61 TaxID=2790937 RepID=UPI003977F10D
MARRDTDGYITYVSRTDDVFKASDYKISPRTVERGKLSNHYCCVGNRYTSAKVR